MCFLEYEASFTSSVKSLCCGIVSCQGSLLISPRNREPMRGVPGGRHGRKAQSFLRAAGRRALGLCPFPSFQRLSLSRRRRNFPRSSPAKAAAVCLFLRQGGRPPLGSAILMSLWPALGWPFVTLPTSSMWGILRLPGPNPVTDCLRPSDPSWLTHPCWANGRGPYTVSEALEGKCALVFS